MRRNDEFTMKLGILEVRYVRTAPICNGMELVPCIVHEHQLGQLTSCGLVKPAVTHGEDSGTCSLQEGPPNVCLAVGSDNVVCKVGPGKTVETGNKPLVTVEAVCGNFRPDG